MSFKNDKDIVNVKYKKNKFFCCFFIQKSRLKFWEQNRFKNNI